MVLAALYLTCLVVGFLVGVTVVGGILNPPALILLSGLGTHTAMGTALASFLPLSLVGTWLYHRLGHLDPAKAVPYVLGGLITAGPGALLNAHVPGGPLILLLALLVIFAGFCAFRPPRVGAGGNLFWQGRNGVFLIGAVTGLLAGLTGAGGPVLSIPWMVVAGFPPVAAVALSMPYQAATALSGTVGNWSGGHVDFSLLPMLCLLEVAGFFGGVAVVRRIPAWLLRRIIGVLCSALGVFLLVRQLMS